MKLCKDCKWCQPEKPMVWWFIFKAPLNYEAAKCLKPEFLFMHVNPVTGEETRRRPTCSGQRILERDGDCWEEK